MASHTRISCALAAIFLLPACGDTTATTTATTVATDPGTGNTGTETTPGTTGTTDTETTGPTTGLTTSTSTSTTMAPMTTVEPTTESSATTTGVTASTTENATTETTETTSAVTTETSGETTDTSGETTEPGTTGDPVGSTCEQDSDCQIYTDCCTCDVLAVGEQPPPCGVPECFVDVCSTLDIGVNAPVCRFGRCTFDKVTCNPTSIICDAAPPNCPLGQLPSVKGDCWSGQCTPVEACDWAPDCAACQTDPTDPLVCVFKAQKGAYHVCEPKPVDCGDAPEIDCECGAEICEASPPHTVCGDSNPGIVCECPFC